MSLAVPPETAAGMLPCSTTTSVLGAAAAEFAFCGRAGLAGKLFSGEDPEMRAVPVEEMLSALASVARDSRRVVAANTKTCFGISSLLASGDTIGVGGI